MKKIKLLAYVLLALPIFTSVSFASDHDDGEFDGKGRNLNLTDHYSFREDSFEGGGGSASNLVLIMNSNPRSLPKQQYFFSTQAVYDFHISRAGTVRDTTGTTNDNIILRFKFGAPNSSNVQNVTMTAIVDGVATQASGSASTTPISLTATPTTVTPYTLTIGANTFTIFAGLRADPFYFDVQGFFSWRAQVATGQNPAVTAYRNNGVNFTYGYNVNAIVVRLPVAFLKTAANETIFDTWTSVSVPQ